MVDFKPCDCDICEEIKEESISDFCECVLCTDTYDGEDRPNPGMEDESMTSTTENEEKAIKDEEEMHSSCDTMSEADQESEAETRRGEEEYDRAHEDYYKEPSFKDEGGF